MSRTMEQLAVEASALSAQDLAELIDRLNVSLAEHPDPEIERAWAKEAQRRWEEVQSGKAKLIPGEEVAAMVRKRIGR